jgi:hypothetical protein
MNAASGRSGLVGRVNFRILLFATAILLMLGWPVWSYVSESWTGGVHDRGAYKEVNLKALGFFQLDPTRPSINDVPMRYRRLDGQKVLLRGLVQPHLQAGRRISEFTLVYSPVSCCVGAGQPLVQERVFATAATGQKWLPYPGDGYYDVLGTLHVNMKFNEIDGSVMEVYQLDCERMTPVE